MNFIRQRMISLKNRAHELQTTLRRWALYDDSVSREMKDDLLGRFTPAEETTFESDLELTKARLRPASTQLQTVSRWYDYVLERVNEQLERARGMLDQGRHTECTALLNDIELRMLDPNEDTLGFVFRCFSQHTSHEYHQKLASIDAIVRDMYLPTVKLAHQRGVVAKEGLSQTPLAYLADAHDALYSWRQHARIAQNFGRKLPISLLAVPRKFLSQPWNILAIAHEVGQNIYTDLDLGWEIANKLQTESIGLGVSATTAPVWALWNEVLFADIFGVAKLGPAYVSAMIELLGADLSTAINVVPGSNVPPAYIRWHVMLQALQLLNFADQARDLFNQIHLLCGDPQQIAQRVGGAWLQLINECRAIAGVIAFSPCQKLGGARIVDIAQPLLATEWQTAMKVRDLLLSGDASISTDDSFSWTGPLSGTQVPTNVALAGLRAAFDQIADIETSRRMWVRFWCLLQYLTGNTEPIREREDREFAPGDALLRHIAHHAVPAIPMPTAAAHMTGQKPVMV
jgi:hypothetical protein